MDAKEKQKKILRRTLNLMQKIIGKEAPVTNHTAEVKTLHREGVYPHPPLKILMSETSH